MSSTPFPIGGYFNDPDPNDPVAQALFLSEVGSFTQLMGAAPASIDYFVAAAQPISSWITNAGYESYTAAQSPYSSSATPVIVLPMSSYASSLTQDQQYQAFASGAYDTVIQGLVRTWAQSGFNTTQYWRVGAEMNIPGPSYAGTDSQTQSDWVAAFQHISSVLHQAGQADGVKVQVVWNPNSSNYDSLGVLQHLYPGNSSVDVIGADMYADAFPYNPLYDWDKNDGTIDANLQQFLADPVNRIHYWNNPAATPYALDGSSGHLLDIQTLLAFAKAQGKPFAVPETGAGSSAGGHDVADDGAFPQWLAQTLTASGDQIAFVNFWDANANGNYDFSSATAGKPQEAAAWAQYFGAHATSAPVPPSPPTQPGTTPGAGTPTDTLVISVSEDAWKGDAQYTVAVDGSQIGGVLTATASHAAGATQATTLSVAGTSGHQVAISFINDAYGGTPSTDRNLYVDGITDGGVSVAGSKAALLSNGTATFTTPASSGVTLLLAEDAYQGDAQFSVALDGNPLAAGSVTASNALGQTQAVSLGVLTPGTHDLALSFLNDLYKGTPSTDRNLYLAGVQVNGSVVPGLSATLLSNGTDHIAIIVPGKT